MVAMGLRGIPHPVIGFCHVRYNSLFAFLFASSRPVRICVRGVAEMSTWEQVLVGALGLLVLVWVLPGIKPMLKKSEEAPKDWAGLLLPIGLVVAFVIFLATTL